MFPVLLLHSSFHSLEGVPGEWKLVRLFFVARDDKAS
jgi:hypothetical protein